MQKIKAKDLMQKDVVTMRQEESLSAAYEHMIQKDIRHLPVVDHKGVVIGILSDRDILVDATTDIDENIRPVDILVKDVMNDRVLTVQPDDSLHDVVTLMIENKIHGIPVVDQQSKIAGMVTSTDVLRMVWSHSFTDKEREHLLANFQNGPTRMDQKMS